MRVNKPQQLCQKCEPSTSRIKNVCKPKAKRPAKLIGNVRGQISEHMLQSAYPVSWHCVVVSSFNIAIHYTKKNRIHIAESLAPFSPSDMIPPKNKHESKAVQSFQWEKRNSLPSRGKDTHFEQIALVRQLGTSGGYPGQFAEWRRASTSSRQGQNEVLNNRTKGKRPVRPRPVFLQKGEGGRLTIGVHKSVPQ